MVVWQARFEQRIADPTLNMYLPYIQRHTHHSKKQLMVRLMVRLTNYTMAVSLTSVPSAVPAFTRTLPFLLLPCSLAGRVSQSGSQNYMKSMEVSTLRVRDFSSCLIPKLLPQCLTDGLSNSCITACVWPELNLFQGYSNDCELTSSQKVSNFLYLLTLLWSRRRNLSTTLTATQGRRC